MLDQRKYPQGVQYEQSIVKAVNQKIYSLLLLQNSQIYNIRSFIRTIITSEQFHEWIVLKALLQCEQVIKITQFYKKILCCIQQLTSQRHQTYVMKIFLYGWVKQNNKWASQRDTYNQLKDLVRQDKLFLFNSWLTQTPDWNNPSTIETLNMICKYYPLLIKAQRILIQISQLQFILQVICHIDLKREQQFKDFDQLLNLTKQFRIGSFNQSKNQMNKQQHVIMKVLLDLLANAKNSRANVGWLFLPTFISQQDIRTFLLYYNEQILNYSQNQLVNIFKKIFRNSMQENALILFQQTSLLLKQQQRYYELKTLYQKVTLPIIIRRGKAKIFQTELILQIGSLYVIGFYSHCDIGKNGLTCLISNINIIQEQRFRVKWIQLALLVADKNLQQYSPFLYNYLEQQGFKREQLRRIDNQKGFQKFSDKTVWQICVRNAKRKKNYSKSKCKDFKGIQNYSSQCYIISVLQALFTTKQLPIILKEYHVPKRTQLCYHLKQLFQNLASRHNLNVNVENVKKYGPQYFAQSFRQQDTQQYLVKLLQMIEDELQMAKQKLLIRQMDRVFKSKITRKLQCQGCGQVIDKQDSQYLHTIPNRSSLRQEQVQKISDYKCQKCGSYDFLNRIKLHPTSRIFIVHINRFSFKNESKKQLATQNIKRQFLGYRLKGIIFHIGKNVQIGHYVYYYHVGGKKWIQMNDSKINEFMLDNQDQEFQLQMKAETTPYILFYVKGE